MIFSFLQGGSEQESSTDLLDSLIYATIVLFILSVITEKLTQLVRMYPGKFRWIGAISCVIFYFPIVTSGLSDYAEETDYRSGIILLFVFNTVCLAFIIANFSFVQKRLWPLVKHLDMLNHVKKGKKIIETAQNEVAKEKEVTILSFILGFIVAYAFKANLFELFHDASSLGWKDISPLADQTTFILNPEYFSFDLLPAIGFILTAFFLAFGSKFFHDLLDTLLYTKNMKRHLDDKSTYEIETVNELETLLKRTEGSLVRMAIQQNLQALQKLSNFLSLHEGPDLKTGRKIAYLNLTNNNTSGIPPQLSYQLEGKTRTVPLKIIPNADVARVSSGKIFNTHSSNFKGTIGVPFILDNDLWLLTCGHVMSGGNYDPATLQGVLATPGQARFSYNGVNLFNGTWEYGFQDLEFDIALIKPRSPAQVIASGLAQDPYPLSTLSTPLPVTFEGAVSSGSGLIFAQHVEEPIMFANQSVWMKGLIKISAPQGIGAISQPGDSGSVLVSGNQAVAIIIASSTLFTYAISLEKIFFGWNAKIQ